MQRFKVGFRPLAEADLVALYDHIGSQSGDTLAAAYIARIEATCRTLAAFPERGTRRNDLAPGLRTIGLERRVTIAFRVVDSEVAIVRIFYGGQDYERRLREQ
jgi:toxin ParE1/3/4